MKRLKLLYARVLENLYLRVIQKNAPLPGTDPDDGGHMEVRFGWNDPSRRTA